MTMKNSAKKWVFDLDFFRREFKKFKEHYFLCSWN